MTNPITVFITTDKEGKVQSVIADSQGVGYMTSNLSCVNGIWRATFEIEGDVDTTPALGVSVADNVQAKTRLG